MAKRNNLITFDFSNFTEKGLKKLIAEFKKAGQKLVDFSGSNRQKRKDGQLIKTAKLFFDSGQSVTIEINNTGDVVRVKVNSTITPITKLQSLSAMAKEIVSHIEQGQKKFDDRMAKKALVALKDKSDTKPASRSLKVRIQEASAANSVAQLGINELKARKATLSEKIASQQSRETQLNASIDEARSKKNDLISQITEFGATPNV